MSPNESLGHRLDRWQLARRARAAGLPDAVAARIAEVVVDSGLTDDRRAEVFRELVAHFQDGLEAGRPATELLASFGDGGLTARLLRREKRIVTPEAHGGTGPGDGWFRRLARDSRYAVRRLVARPAFTMTAILSLAVGIGANSAMFTLVNEVIFRRPPTPEPDRLVHIYTTQNDFAFNVFSYPDLEDIEREATDVFSVVGGSKLTVAAREASGQTERLMAEAVTPNYLGLLGVRTRLGRLFEPTDAPAPGVGSVVVLSESYWRRAFGSDRDIVGRTIRLSGREFTVIGVLSGEFTGTMRGIVTAFYAPITMIAAFEPSTSDPLRDRGAHGIFVQARLRPGVSLGQARLTVDRLVASFKERRVGDWHGADAIKLVPATDVIMYPPLDRILAPVAWMVMVVVGLVLIIACANLAGFLLARAVDRKKEIAVRLSLGATRAQLVSQLLVETVLLAVAGGGLGIVLGRTALKAVLAADLPLPVPLGFDLPLDRGVLLFSIVVSLAAGLGFGLAPALQATQLNIASVIRLESGTGGRSRQRVRNALVGGQVAVAILLLVGAGLFIRSLDAIRQVDPGFGHDPSAIVVVGSPARATAASVSQMVERLEIEIGRLPGVVRVAATSNIHLGMWSNTTTSVIVDGVPPPPGYDAHSVDRAAIDTGFIAAIGLRLRQGRNFRATDDSVAARVAIVNEAFVARFFPGKDPVGQHYRQPSGAAVEIVGVVNTAKIRTIAEDPRPFVYLPLAQSSQDQVWLVANTRGSPELALDPIERTVHTLYPDVVIWNRRTMDRQLAIQSLPLELAASLLGGFAILALALASVGLYGTVSYSVAQRTREVGIRLSLGADRTAVTRLLLWSGLKVVLIGAVVGLGSAALLARLLQGLLYGVRALDPMTFLAVPAALIGVGVVAAYLPARRAGRVDPLSALRAE
jgi:predicted permease